MFVLLKRWYWRHFSQPGTIEFALVLVGAFLIVYYFMWLVGPIVVALCLSYCLDWAVRWAIRRFRISRFCAATLTMTLFIGLCVGIMLFVVPKLLQQGSEFYQKAQEFSQNASESADIADENLDEVVASTIYDLIERMPEPLSSMVSREEIEVAVNDARTSIMKNLTVIIKTQIMPSVMNVATWLMYVVIVPIFMFLMLANKHVLQRRIRTYILPNNQALISVFWPRINAQIEGYIRGKLIHIFVITIVNTIAFLFFDLNFSFLLGLGVGLSVVIPYVGAVIITVPIILIGMVQFGLSSTFFYLLAVYIIIQLLDSNVLTPYLFSKAMNLDAFSILAAIMIFGGLWGFWGVFFSIPLATFIGTLIVHWPNAETDPPLKALGGGKAKDETFPEEEEDGQQSTETK